MAAFLLVFYILGFLLAIGCLALANSKGSFSFAYFGMFVILLLGMALMSFGVDIETGFEIGGTEFGNVNASAAIVGSDTYTNYTTDNNWVVLIIANLFFYGAFGMMVATTFFALKHEGEEY